jgi:hypothetical protein
LGWSFFSKRAALSLMSAVALVLACSGGGENLGGGSSAGAAASAAGMVSSAGASAAGRGGTAGGSAGLPAVAGSGQGGTAQGGTTSGTGGEVGEGMRVPKTNPKQIYAHVMPWFESPQTSDDGKWGSHWTMANRDPNQQDGSGRRSIASHFYPLIGPYGSSDADVVEYQLLLMKYAGIDGILMDWPTTLQAYDYAKNLKNAEAMLNRAREFGLDFAVVYEDQNIKAGGAPDFRAAGKNDMSYLRDHYFNQPNYIQVAGAPLVLVFGPQTFQSPEDWSDLFSVLPQRPTFLTLWYESEEAGELAAGEYAWVYMNNGKLDEFYARSFGGLEMGSVYPGFKAFYSEGNWGTNPFEIPHDGSATFAANLDKALSASGIEHVQIATWNDYGEGTMIEPTRELMYGCLTLLQQKLGVPFGQAELELVARLYEKRKAGSDAAKLDQASSALNQLQPAQAQTILDTL